MWIWSPIWVGREYPCPVDRRKFNIFYLWLEKDLKTLPINIPIASSDSQSLFKRHLKTDTETGGLSIVSRNPFYIIIINNYNIPIKASKLPAKAPSPGTTISYAAIFPVAVAVAELEAAATAVAAILLALDATELADNWACEAILNALDSVTRISQFLKSKYLPFPICLGRFEQIRGRLTYYQILRLYSQRSKHSIQLSLLPW